MFTSEELRDQFHYLFRDELPELKRLVRSLPANPLVVNIGAGAGTSGLAIMEARPDAMLITFDIQDASSPFGCLEAEREVIARAGMANSGRHWQYCLDSKIAANEWAERGFGEQRLWERPDMVFIDGDHSYEGASGDIKGWLPLLREGGILAVHDYRKADFEHSPDGPHPMPWPGVDQAVDELLRPLYVLESHVDSLIAFRKERLQ